MNLSNFKTPFLLAVVGGALVGCSPPAPADVSPDGQRAVISDGTQVRVIDYAAGVAAHTGGTFTNQGITSTLMAMVDPAANSPRVIRTVNVNYGWMARINDIRVSPINNGDRALVVVNHTEGNRWVDSFAWIGLNSNYGVRINRAPFDGFGWGFLFSPDGSRLAAARSRNVNNQQQHEVAIWPAPPANAAEGHNVGNPTRIALPQAAGQPQWYDNRSLLMLQGQEVVLLDTANSSRRTIYRPAAGQSIVALGRSGADVMVGTAAGNPAAFRAFRVSFDPAGSGLGNATQVGPADGWVFRRLVGGSGGLFGEIMRFASDGEGMALIGHRLSPLNNTSRIERAVVHQRFNQSTHQVFTESETRSSGSTFEMWVRPNSILTGENMRRFTLARTGN